MTSRTNTKRTFRGMITVALLALLALRAGVATANDPPRTTPSEPYSSRALVSEAEAALAAGHPGRAILAYERAALVTSTPAVSEGLAHARTVAGLPPPRPTLTGWATRRLSADRWASIAMCGLLLAAVGIGSLGWGLLRRRGFILVVVSGASIAGVGLVTALQGSPPPDRAVVVAPAAVARIAPFADAEASFRAREGAEATLERIHDEFALIRTPDGEGWVPRDAVVTIVPPPPHASSRS